MTNKVTIKSTKEPVRLRVKNLANGVQSLYLDCYVDGKRSYEFLKLYLIPEKGAMAKAQNEATLQAANAIKMTRILEITNNKAGLKNTSLKAKQTLADWMETFKKKQAHKGCAIAARRPNRCGCRSWHEGRCPLWQARRPRLPSAARRAASRLPPPYRGA